MNIKYQKFHVGVNVLVVRDNQILLGKRKNVYGAGTWGLPGGHLEEWESMKEAASRELFEETGLKANNFEFINLVNDIEGNKEHYLQIGFITKDCNGEPDLKEPDRCEEWRWFKINSLPDKLFSGHNKQIKLFLKNLKFGDK